MAAEGINLTALLQDFSWQKAEHVEKTEKAITNVSQQEDVEKAEETIAEAIKALSLNVPLQRISSSSDGCELSMRSSLWIEYKDYRTKIEPHLEKINNLSKDLLNGKVRVRGPTVNYFFEMNPSIKKGYFEVEKVYEKFIKDFSELEKIDQFVKCYLENKISTELNKSLREDNNNRNAYFVLNSNTFYLASRKYSSFDKFDINLEQTIANAIARASEKLEEFFKGKETLKSELRLVWKDYAREPLPESLKSDTPVEEDKTFVSEEETPLESLESDTPIEEESDILIKEKLLPKIFVSEENPPLKIFVSDPIIPHFPPIPVSAAVGAAAFYLASTAAVNPLPVLHAPYKALHPVEVAAVSPRESIPRRAKTSAQERIALETGKKKREELVKKNLKVQSKNPKREREKTGAKEKMKKLGKVAFETLKNVF
jgi:hypothetical protein